MQRTVTKMLCASAALTVALPAMAMPPILDRVPANAPLVISIPSLDKVNDRVQALSTAAEFQFGPMIDVKQLLAMGGFAGAIDTTRSAAMVVMEGDVEADNPPVVMLVPTTDFNELVEASFAEEQNGLWVAEMEGEPAYIRDIGEGYAAVSDSRDTVTGFALAKGNAPKLRAAMGEAGAALADESAIVITADIQKLKPWMDAAADMIAENMDEQMAGGMPIEMANPVESPLAEWIENRIKDDARFMVAGVSPTARGLAVEMTMTFADGSYLDKVFASANDAGRLMAKVPNQQYLMAWAIDSKTPATKKLYADLSKVGKDAVDESMPNFMLMNVDESFENVDGQMFLMGSSPAAMFGAGVFANSLNFIESAKPAAVVSSMQAMIEDADGIAAEGMELATSYKGQATTVNGVSADEWQMKFIPDGTDPMAAQASQMMFGSAGGPTGYVAQAKDGVVMTLGKNSLLLGAALNSAQGQADALSTDRMTSQIGERLPDNTLVEGYLGTQSVLEMVGPLAAMFMGIELDVPENVPPIGFAIGSSGGDAHAGVFLPTTVFKVAGEIANGVAGQMDFAGEDDDAGQPRF